MVRLWDMLNCLYKSFDLWPLLKIHFGLIPCPTLSLSWAGEQQPGHFWSILLFPIPPLPDKTFWKFSDFHSENGLKSILTIIVMGNRQRFTSFCFWSWFLENEMLPDKTFWQRIQIYIICWWSTALFWCILLSTGLYSTIFNHKSRIRW